MTMVLQIALAEAVGDAEAFFHHALPSELSLLRGTAKTLGEKAFFISGRSSDVHVEPMIAGISGLIERMSSLVPVAQDSTASEQVQKMPMGYGYDHPNAARHVEI